jgi:hypothetical protein
VYNARLMGDVGARLETRILVRVALWLWLLAALATVWEALALQAPDSPLHFGILAGPIVQLRDHCFAQGAGMFIAALLWPMAHAEKRGLFTLALLLSGVLVGTAALAYAASEGILGAQVFDPRQDARRVLYARGVGLSLWMLALVDLFARSFRARN